MAWPRISVVTPSFNQGAFIRATIESVLAQHYPNFEHIVVDGGSTDDTVDILKSYPHLQWTSEPDQGQADALNIGFRRASGEIIAWINSDDWYAPGAFHAVADRLRDHRVVMGPCQIVDKHGRPTELTLNLEHSWFDILKYWVYDSIPTQPSIFFRRSLLDDVRLPGGDYVDPDLDFCMDFDLWLRMAHRCPFTARLDQVLSYYRIYDGNKTGGDWGLIFKEASRVFARHANSGSERRVTVAMALGDGSERLERTLRALARQTFDDFEVVLVGPMPFARCRPLVHQLATRYDRVRLRYVSAATGGAVPSLNRAVSCACAPIVCMVPSGSEVPPDFCLRIANAFADDRIALLIGGVDGLDSRLTPATVTHSPCRTLEALLSCAATRHAVAVRRVAFIEVDGCRADQPGVFALAELYLRLLHKGWHVGVEHALRLLGAAPPEAEPAWLPALGSQLVAKLVVDLQAEYEAEPFARVRAGHDWCVRFSPELVEWAQQALRSRAC